MRKASLSVVLVGALALGACSQKTEDAAHSTVEAAKEDAAAAASDAVQDGTKAVDEAASKSADAVSTAAAKAADAVGDAANDLHAKVTRDKAPDKLGASPSPAH